MDLNFPVFATGVRIFRASNDVGPLFVGTGATRILKNLVFVWTQDPSSLLALKIRTPVANTGKLRSIGQMPVRMTDCFMSVIIVTIVMTGLNRSSGKLITIMTTIALSDKPDGNG